MKIKCLIFGHSWIETYRNRIEKDRHCKNCGKKQFGLIGYSWFDYTQITSKESEQ